MGRRRVRVRERKRAGRVEEFQEDFKRKEGKRPGKRRCGL
jgi:hypothetical protein